MGEAGRKILKIDIKWMLQQLNRAYADEWLAHYYMNWAANAIEGPNSKEIAEVLKEGSKQELGHANRLAERILELGGEPERDIEKLAKVSSGNPKFPKDSRDINGFLNAFIGMERGAIKFYNEIAEKTHGKDLVSHELFEELLADEVGDEEEFENLL
ncbi:hypothetical protein J4212_04960 [Candidatus Woesearchaeota archaeon]|nr:hypothetical protein [Candidatus Woesearchaeota archaeon]